MYFWIFWIIFSSIFLGVLGFIASLFSILIYFLFKAKFFKIVNIKDKGLNKKTQRENLMLDLTEVLEKEKNIKFDINRVKSYKQILYYGTVREKIELIGMVVYNPSSEFVDLIRIALDDDDETVRILSSTSLQKMESYYEDKIKEFRKDYEISTIPRKKNLYFRKLILTYDNYIDSTLIESYLKDIYINRMFKEFETISDIKKNKLILYVYIKMSVKYNKLEGIEDIILELIDKRDCTSDKFLLIEFYYKQSNFTKLYEVLNSINIDKIKNIKQIDSYEYWRSI